MRDTAAVLVAAVGHEPGGRYLVPGTDVTSLHEPLRQVTGRRLPMLRVPPLAAEIGTLPGYLTGWSFLPGAREGARITGCANRVDFSATTLAFGVGTRPLTESLVDTVHWLVAAGHLSARLAGRARPST